MRVWILQEQAGCPTVTEYESVRVNRKSVTVREKGRAVIMQQRPGRQFFTDYVKLDSAYRLALQRVLNKQQDVLDTLKRKMRAAMTIERPNLRFSLNVDTYRLRR